MKKKLASLLLAAVMVFSLLPFAALAEHTHYFTFYASGNVLTATCEAEECPEGYGSSPLTLTLNAQSGIYDGDPKPASLDGKDAFETATDLSVGSITYNGDSSAPVNAGTYTAGVSAAGKEIQATFTISKATPTADLFTFRAPEDLVYDGNPKEAALIFDDPSGKLSGVGNVSVRYRLQGEEIWTEDAPKDAGTYEVGAVISEGINFMAAMDLTSSGWTFTITPDSPGHVHGDVIFQPWTDSTALPDTPGSWALDGDVTLSATWTVPEGSTNLCLNGHTIRGTGGAVIQVPSGAVLNLYDCQGGGKVTGGTSGGVSVSGIFNMAGGAISGNSASNGGGVSVYSGGVFNMNDGSISGNTAYGGGGVYLDPGAVFNMSGGSISGNTATGFMGTMGGGGGVRVMGGTLNMTGGSISGNSATGTMGFDQNGGGVIAINGTFRMTGGTISGNSGTATGGVYLASSPANIGGSASITGNKSAGGDATNLCLAGGTISLSSPTTSINVGITMATPGVFTSNSGDGFKDCFTSDKSGYAVVYTDGQKLMLTKTYTVTVADAENGTVTADKTAAAAGETVTLTVTPDTGYQLKSLKYSDGTSDTDIPESAGTYSFTMPDKDVTVSAEFEGCTYAIEYKDMGGGAFSGTHETGYPTVHTYGAETALKGATKTDWLFAGWFTASDCSGEAVTSLGATAYTADITLYAKWAVDYKIIAGMNAVWTKNSSGGCSFTSNAPFVKFSSVKVDDKTVATASYTVAEGSTKVTLLPAYLNTLAVGKHTITIVSIDGSASTNFTIKSAASGIDAPKTGDGSHPVLWAVLLAAGSGVYAWTAIYRRRRNTK